MWFRFCDEKMYGEEDGQEKGLSVRTALIGWFGCCFLTWH